jgi:hypothetical protein
MNSLVEAVSTIVLFILTPVIVVWVQISLAKVIENIGELPIEAGETRRFIAGPGILRRLCLALTGS